MSQTTETYKVDEVELLAQLERERAETEASELPKTCERCLSKAFYLMTDRHCWHCGARIP